MKKNICWEHEQKNVRRSASRKSTGSWYDCLLLFCGACLCVWSAYLQMYGMLDGMNGLAPEARVFQYLFFELVLLVVFYGSGVFSRLWMRIFPVLPFTFFAIRFYLRHQLQIEDGILYMLRMYVAKICKYYECMILFPQGIRSEAPMAFTFWLLVVVAGLFVLAGIFHRMGLLGLLPIAMLIASVAVGEVPGLQSMLIGFSGVLMLRMYAQGKRERVRVRAAQLVGILCICIITGAACSGYADNVVAGHDKMMERQLALEDAVLALNVWDLFSEDGTVTNDAPLGNGREVLTITLSDQPTENVYLKTYAADHYENGKWSTDGESFVQAAAEQGLTPEQAGAFVCNMPLDEGEPVLEPEDPRAAVDYVSIAAPKQYEYTITCNNFGKSAPIPYVSRLPEDFVAKADTAAEKPWTKRQYSGMLTMGGNHASPLIDYLVYYYMTAAWTLESHWIGDLDAGDVDAKNDWYSAYVRGHDQNSNLSGAAAQRLDEYLQFLGWKGIEEFQTYQRSIQDVGNPSLTNSIRMGFVPMIQAILQNLGTYSRSLDPLPAGTDPIDYFLNTSGEGYCVHFASAATLMLQSMGIPARYASGYVVFPKDFKKTEGTYTAVVTDVRAHAWTEVYLDGFGWIPYEATPGFSDGSTPEEQAPAKDAADNKNEQQKEQDTKTDQTEEEQKETDQPENDPLGQTDLSQDKISADQKLLETEFFGRTILWWLGVLIALIGVYFLICLFTDGVRLYQRRLEQRIRWEIAEGHNRKAILWINRRMYRMLSRRALLVGRRIRDDVHFRRAFGWFSAFREASVDVETYMELVKKAYFSEDEMRAEDAEIVYEIYLRCRMSKKNRIRLANTAYRQTEK